VSSTGTPQIAAAAIPTSTRIDEFCSFKRCEKYLFPRSFSFWAIAKAAPHVLSPSLSPVREGSRIEKASGEPVIGAGMSQVRVISGIATIRVVRREDERKLELIQSIMDTNQFSRTVPPSFCLPTPRFYLCDPVPPPPLIRLGTMSAHLRRRIISTGSQICGLVLLDLDSWWCQSRSQVGERDFPGRYREKKMMVYFGD
jgi:hypothetical protein